MSSFTELTEDEYFCTEDGAKAGVTLENTSETEPLVCLRYFGPEVNPDAPAMGAYRKNKFSRRVVWRQPMWGNRFRLQSTTQPMLAGNDTPNEKDL